MNNRPLTQEEIDDYGENFVDVMRRVAAETAGPLQAEIQSLKGQLGHVQAETGHAFLTRMNTTLDALVPGWRELNKDQRFIEWSQLPDVFSGEIRKNLMQRAWDSGDPERVAACFRAYSGGGQAQQGGGSTYYPHLPSGTPQGRDVNLYTPDQISRFYRDVVAGRWRNRERERAALDADIQRASAEGRIVGADGRPVGFLTK